LALESHPHLSKQNKFLIGSEIDLQKAYKTLTKFEYSMEEAQMERMQKTIFQYQPLMDYLLVVHLLNHNFLIWLMHVLKFERKSFFDLSL
jgi:hypothetical protein